MPDTGCQLWGRGVTTHGYGVVRYNGRNVRVARLVMAWSYGYELDEVPSHIVTRHLCPAGPDKRCVRPGHLLAGTVRQNTADAMADGTMPWTFVDGRCGAGHDVSDPEAVYMSSDGKRRCRECSLARQRKWQACKRHTEWLAAAITETEHGQLALVVPT